MQGLKEQKTPSQRRQAAAASTACCLLPTKLQLQLPPTIPPVFSAFDLHAQLPQQSVFHLECERLQYTMWLTSEPPDINAIVQRLLK